jgi:hypothetical protein
MSYDEPGNLVNGGPLIVEDLDLSGMGVYSQDQKDKLIAEGAPEDDFFLGDGWFTGYWQRKSDEGIKWHIYEDKDLKLWKDIVKENNMKRSKGYALFALAFLGLMGACFLGITRVASTPETKALFVLFAAVDTFYFVDAASKAISHFRNGN